MNILSKARVSHSAQTLLLSALANLADGILLCDADERLVHWNSSFQSLLPQGTVDLAEDMPLTRLLASLAALAEDGLGSEEEWVRRHLALARIAGKADLPLRDGRWLCLAWTIADGCARMLRVTDVTSRRQREGVWRERESRWRDFAESMADWMWESDQDFRLTYASEGFTRLTGISWSGEDAQPATALTRRFVAEEGQWLRHRAVLDQRAAFRDFRVRFTDDQGRVHHFRISGKPVHGSDGRFRGYRGTGTDITLEVESETDERKARERLISAIENLSEDFMLFDEHDRLVLCNHRYRHSMSGVIDDLMPGISFEEVTRLTALSGLNPEAVGRVEDWVRERVELHRQGACHEQKHVGGNWVLIKDLRLQDGGTVVTRTDITELKRREQALSESEARFRAIFEHAAIGMAIIKPGGHIAKANQALGQMLGYGATELAEMNYVAITHPDDRAEDARLARRLVNGKIDHYCIEKRYLRKDGSQFWGRLTASLVRGEGPERFAITMIEDIDNRKQAEADLSMFRALVEASHEAVAMTKPDGRLIYVNSAHERLFGRSQAESAHLSYRDHYLPPSQVIIDREVIPALRRGESWEGVLGARDASDRNFPLWQRAGVVRNAAGKPQFFFAFMHDHTGQKQVEDELCKAKEAAEQANLAKTRFLAAASHDLRQPLQALSMFVAVLSARNSNSDQAGLISKIQDSVNAVEGLLNGLLDVSKLEAGLVVPVEETFSLTNLMQRLADEFEPLTEAEGLSLRFVPCRLMVRSDAALLERILRNLLNNAVRYTTKGRILFGCRRKGDKLRIEVWDTGIGIPKNQMKLIFREFHQLGNPNRDRRQGLGLGLAIVERLAALLGHQIHVDSEPEKGSVFAIELPIVRVARITHPPRQLTLGIARQGALVVVIDDEPDVLESTRLLLESWGHKVLTALNCDDALRRLPELGRKPDLILADYRLQNGMTGGQAIARLRVRLKAPIPAIILTGDTAPERLRQAQASGHGLLHKPVQPDSLRQAIDDILAANPPGRQRAARSQSPHIENRP